MEQTPPQTPLAALPYEPDPSGPRRAHRGYRLLVALTVLNSLMFLGYFLGPPSWRYGRKVWQDRQQAAQARQQQQQARLQAKAAAQRQVTDAILAQERAAAERKQKRETLLALLEACRAHQFPPDAVAFEQDPAEAERLSALNAGYVHVPLRFTRGLVHPPVRLPAAAEWEALRDALELAATATTSPATVTAVRPRPQTRRLFEAGAPIFMGQRQADGEGPRLVVVLQRAESGGGVPEDEAVLSLTACSIGLDVPGDANQDVRVGRRLEVIGGTARLDFVSPRDADGKTAVKTAFMLRLHTGRPDPFDASRFTFDAYSDGRPVGRLACRLETNGEVRFEPEGGRTERPRGVAVRWRPADWRDHRRAGVRRG